MDERHSGHKIKVLRRDRGGEYVSKNFNTLYTKEGIMHETVPSYTPQQNGIAERKNITIMNMVKSMSKIKHIQNEI